MTRGQNSLAQNRGRRWRMTPTALDSCTTDMDRLAAELGVPTIPVREPTPAAREGMTFGLPEAIAVFAVYATGAGLISVF